MKKAFGAMMIAITLLLSLLSGCAGGTPVVTVIPEVSETPATSAAPSTQPEDTTSKPGEVKLPLTSDKVTFTIWNGPYSSQAGMKDPNDSFAYQEAEKRTNIHIEWMQPAQGQEMEQFNLIVASQNYPDSFFAGKNYFVGGYDGYISNDIIIDLRDLAEKYAPNYMAMARLDDVTWKNNLTDSGYIPGFYNISEIPQPTFWGPQVREDWLKDLGLAEPKTYDDWYNMLKTFKDEKGAANGYMMNSTSGLDDAMMVGFGIINGFYKENNKVKYGPAEPAYRDYVTEMNKWYKEGLIDPDFGSRTNYLNDAMPLINSGKSGAWIHFYIMIDTLKMMAEDKDFQSVAVTVPKVNAGDKRHMTIYNTPESRVGTAVNTITTTCKDPVTLVKWFDYFYSDEGSLLADYGVEGQGYNLVDGKPVLSDLVTKNPEGLAMNQVLPMYTIGTTHSRKYDWSRALTPDKSDYVRSAGPKWDSDFENTGSMLSVTMTQEESAEYTSIFNDIQTFVQEKTISFIQNGFTSEDLDKYFASIQNMNIGRCIEIQQAALDRYLAR